MEVLPKNQYEKLARENYQLLSEVKSLRNINRELGDEIAHLEAHILEESRLRKLIRALVLKFDSVITVHLTKRTKNKKRYPPIDIHDVAETPETILAAIQRADKQVFISKPSLLHRVEAIFFKSVYVVYRAITRLLFRCMRYIKRKIARS